MIRERTTGVFLLGFKMLVVAARKCGGCRLLNLVSGALFTLLFFLNPSAAQSLDNNAYPSLFRVVDVLVEIPHDFATNPETGEFFSKQELEAQVLTAFAGASTYFRPLGLVLNVRAILQREVGEADPYARAIGRRNPYEVLKTAVKRHENLDREQFDLVVVLGRSYLNGYAGLAYPGVSCVLPKYSVVFATQGGDTSFHRYVLQQTLAHEIGHYLGMEHDDVQYPSGPSLMWNGFVRYASGFSENSLKQAQLHLSDSRQGSLCFSNGQLGRNSAESDADTDGFSDVDERSFGTDVNDPGSRPASLKSPVYTLWNSFLDVLNIVELVNPGDVQQKVILSLYTIDGSLGHRQEFLLEAHSQFDVILNDLPNFQENSYGLVALEFEGRLDGRTSYYRVDESRDGYEFAFSVPFGNPVFGRTAVSFNTFQPSQNSEEIVNQVANWLSVVNLSSVEQIFGVYSFDNEGRVIGAKTMRVPGFGRVDLDGGHGFGSSKIGFHEILPANPEAPYYAQLVRYGANAAAGFVPDSYSFAFPLVARAGNGQPVSALISSVLEGEENWLEVTNTQTAKVNAKMHYFGEQGELLRLDDLVLLPHTQQHLNASEILLKAGHAFGSVQIVPDTENSLLIESMFYYRDQGTGRVRSLHGIAAKEAIPDVASGSYNLFLGMENWLLVSSDSPEPVQLKVSVNKAQSVVVNLPAFGSQRLAVHDSGLFGTSSDSYGYVELNSDTPFVLHAELIRVRKTSAGIDFVAPSGVR